MSPCCGAPSGVVKGADNYVRIAVDLALDPGRLATLRRDQRGRIASPLQTSFPQDKNSPTRPVLRALTPPPD